jgi:hypothetical protein
MIAPDDYMTTRDSPYWSLAASGAEKVWAKREVSDQHSLTLLAPRILIPAEIIPLSSWAYWFGQLVRATPPPLAPNNIP